jgi:hypothetical protein
MVGHFNRADYGILREQPRDKLGELQHFTAQNTLMETQRLRCKVYDKLLLVKEPNGDTKEMYKLAGLTIPEKLKLPLKRM